MELYKQNFTFQAAFGNITSHNREYVNYDNASNFISVSSDVPEHGCSAT